MKPLTASILLIASVVLVAIVSKSIYLFLTFLILNFFQTVDLEILIAKWYVFLGLVALWAVLETLLIEGIKKISQKKFNKIISLGVNLMISLLALFFFLSLQIITIIEFFLILSMVSFGIKILLKKLKK